MDNQLWSMLNDSEQALLRDVEPDALADADEDALVELHQRVRRARNKYSKMHRRRGAAEVGKAGRRSSTVRHDRTLRKAEAFEDALARVSKALAKAAKESAAELKRQRLEAARAVKAGGRRPRKGEGGTKPRSGKRSTSRSLQSAERGPAKAKRDASTKAAGKRRQATRDSR